MTLVRDVLLSYEVHLCAFGLHASLTNVPNAAWVPLLPRRHFLFLVIDLRIHATGDITNPIPVWSLSEMALSSLCQEMGKVRGTRYHRNEVEDGANNNSIW